MARREVYYQLADARPASRKYALRRDGGKGGWITRAEVFLPPALQGTVPPRRILREPPMSSGWNLLRKPMLCSDIVVIN